MAHCAVQRYQPLLAAPADRAARLARCTRTPPPKARQKQHRLAQPEVNGATAQWDDCAWCRHRQSLAHHLPQKGRWRRTDCKRRSPCKSSGRRARRQSRHRSAQSSALLRLQQCRLQTMPNCLLTTAHALQRLHRRLPSHRRWMRSHHRLLTGHEAPLGSMLRRGDTAGDTAASRLVSCYDTPAADPSAKCYRGRTRRTDAPAGWLRLRLLVMTTRRATAELASGAATQSATAPSLVPAAVPTRATPPCRAARPRARGQGHAAVTTPPTSSHAGAAADWLRAKLPHLPPPLQRLLPPRRAHAATSSACQTQRAGDATDRSAWQPIPVTTCRRHSCRLGRRKASGRKAAVALLL